jgi:hypothetical protein
LKKYQTFNDNIRLNQFEFIETPDSFIEDKVFDELKIKINKLFEEGKCSAEKINGEYSWKLCNSFLQIIQDTGGLPRALQFMLTICFNKLNENGEAFFKNILGQDFDKIFSQTTIMINEKYGIFKSIKENERLALELLYCCMTEKLVTPEECLDSNDKTRTIESLGTDTHIILKESYYPDSFYIVPFFFVVLYINILRIIPIELGDTL